MVPIPSEAEEDGRRPLRERQDLIRERLAITNKIDGVLATLGISGYRALRRDRREQLEALRRPGGDPLPVHANHRGSVIRLRLGETVGFYNEREGSGRCLCGGA